jgi:hypothetical protein
MESLHWPEGYKVEQYVPKEWFENWPFSLVFFWLGKPLWIYKDRFKPVIIEIETQLISRPKPSHAVWGTDQNRVKMAQDVCAIVKDIYGWPNDYFIPQDPFDVVFQMTFGEFELAECIVRFQEELSVNIGNQEAEKWSGKSMGDMVDCLLARREP